MMSVENPGSEAVAALHTGMAGIDAYMESFRGCVARESC